MDLNYLVVYRSLAGSTCWASSRWIRHQSITLLRSAWLIVLSARIRAIKTNIKCALRDHVCDDGTEYCGLQFHSRLRTGSTSLQPKNVNVKEKLLGVAMLEYFR